VTERPNAPATDRNREAILEVLVDEFSDRHEVLEIGSGTGQHAVYFANAMSHLIWQTSDVAGNHTGIRSWIEFSNIDNVKLPLDLNVESENSIDGKFDAVYSSNTAHIMSMHAVERMFELVGKLLPMNGKFCLYGPFNRNGDFTSESNARFDASLRSQDPSMGIRNFEDLEALAEKAGMQRSSLYAMPANNFMAVWISTIIR
jgi:cyclopropane fatty-acyl-phospholipid synthase-like methyltransferase